MATSGQGHWVRVIRANGSDQTLWCINTGEARALQVYRRELRKAEPGDQVEWGVGNGDG